MLNCAIIMGRLTAAPELKQTQNGIGVLSFSVAVERSYAKEEGQKQTDFINCIAWRNTALFISKYFHKGDMIAVQGEIQTRTWTDNQGQKRYATEIVVGQASFCGGKNTTESNPTTKPEFEEIETDSQLPF